MENTITIPAPAGKTKEAAIASSPNTKKSNGTIILQRRQSAAVGPNVLTSASNRQEPCVSAEDYCLHERIKRWRCSNDETTAREKEDAEIRVKISTISNIDRRFLDEARQ